MIYAIIFAGCFFAVDVYLGLKVNKFMKDMNDRIHKLEEEHDLRSRD